MSRSKIRSVLAIGLLWGLAWAFLSTAINAVFMFGMGGWPLLITWFVKWAWVHGVIGSVVGFVVGTAFAAFLGRAERAGEAAEIPMVRAALWGGAGAAVVATVFMSAVGLLGGAGAVLAGTTLAAIYTVIGMVSGAGTVAIARKGREPTMIAGS